MAATIAVVASRVDREILLVFEPDDTFGKLFSPAWEKESWADWVKGLGYKTYIDLWSKAPLVWDQGQVALAINRLYDALEHGGHWRLEFETPEAAREAFPALVEATKTAMRAVTARMAQVLRESEEVMLEFAIPDQPDEDNE